MKILGIDPGIGRTGYGIIEVISSKLQVISFGCFETEPNSKPSDRLMKIYDKIIELIKKYKPEALSIEELFFNNNAKTAFLVGQARGVILLAAEQKKVPIFIYTPLQVKVAVTGYGRAEKSQVGKMVKAILKLDKIPKPDDTTDALAIALCHAFSSKIRSTNIETRNNTKIKMT
ncbi:MAG: crossover junction endodeoxyribonuclease RuvC [bacterium]|nr:crossover junction endodeoxyribonuclease RuvC [bacterium]